MYYSKRAGSDTIAKQRLKAVKLLNALKKIIDIPLKSHLQKRPDDRLDEGLAYNIGQRSSNNKYVGTMPLGILCKEAHNISFEQVTQADKVMHSSPAIKIKGNISLHPIGKIVFERVTSSVGNKRVFSMNFTQLRAYEIQRQCERAKNSIMSQYREIVNNFKDLPYLRKLYLKQQIKLYQTTIARIESDNYVKIALQYIIRKKKSSVLPGKKYRDLLIYKSDGTLDEAASLSIVAEYLILLCKRLKEVVQILVEYEEYICEGYILTIEWPNFNFGIRQRPGDEDEEKPTTNAYEYDCSETKHRDRWVIFVWPLGHIWVVYTKDEVHDIEIKIINDYAKMCPFIIDSPIISKGKIYAKLRARLKEGEKGWMGDGVGWEVFAGMLTKVFGVVWLGFCALASGISLTSLTGIIAMIWVLMYFQQRGQINLYYISTFGDDLVAFGNMVDLPSIVEQDKDSQDYWINLGVSLMYNQVLAMKFFKDRGDKMHSEEIATIGSKAWVNYSTINQRIVMYIVYGFCSDIVTLIDMIGKVDYQGGGNMSEYLEVELPSTPWWDELVKFDAAHLSEYWDSKYITDIDHSDEGKDEDNYWIQSDEDYIISDAV